MSNEATAMPGPASFGDLLRRYRAAAMLSQVDLAARAGLSVRGISDLERGIRTHPFPETVRRLADALDLDPVGRQVLYTAAHSPRAETPLATPTDPAATVALLRMPQVTLIGREAEVAAIDALLRAGDARLVTVTGPGGVGKTRLAQAVAHGLADRFGAEIVFVDLSPVKEPWLVLPKVAQTLGVDGSDERGTVETLATAIGDLRMLLVLDNFEQVTDAATDLAAILARCPSLNVLATSREVLRIAAERVFPVPPLPLPDATTPQDPDTLLAFASVELFVERARAVAPEFRLTATNAAAVVALVQNLDGLPLAIELAAGWVPALPLDTLQRRLARRLPLLAGGMRDVPERQRTMRGAIAWSYDLLPPFEQFLFRRLAVFVGGFTLEAAEAVAGDRGQVLRGIASLIDRSVVQRPNDGRYLMLETIREYGLEQLEASGEGLAAHRAHASWALDLVQRAENAGQVDTTARRWEVLESEQPNLRAALEWTLAGGDVASGQRMAVELVEFWWLRGNPIEGRAWLERALAAPPEPSLRMRAALRTGLAEVLWAVGDYVRSLEHSSAALEVWQEVGDEPGAAACLHHMAVVAHDLGDYTRAARLYETSLQIYRTLGDELSAIRCQADLGLAVMHQGDLERAAALQEEALALARVHDEPTLVANGVFNLAEIYRRLGDTARAVAHYRDSLVTHWALRERKFVIDDLLGLALMAAELRQDEDAAWLAGADAHMREEIGARITPQPERVAYERALERVRARMGHPAFTAAKTAGGEAGERAAIPTAIEIAARLARLAPTEPSGAELPAPLSPREIEVLHLLSIGKSDREIGAALFISYRTVNGHVANIYRKLGVNSRPAAVTEAVRQGLLSPVAETGG